MKKVYIVPTVATYEICTDGMLALSKTDDVTLTKDDFDTGAYEVCTKRKKDIGIPSGNSISIIQPTQDSFLQRKA